MASYLDYPRIHFHGPYRADPATSNNINCFFDPDIDVYKDDVGNIKNWNYIGTNEFSIQNTFVTGVTTSNEDTTNTVIGASVLDSRNRPFTKMVDIEAILPRHKQKDFLTSSPPTHQQFHVKRQWPICTPYFMH